MAAAEETKKCKHPSCSCTVASGAEYCGVKCEAVKQTPDVECVCNHPGCRGRLH